MGKTFDAASGVGSSGSDKIYCNKQSKVLGRKKPQNILKKKSYFSGHSVRFEVE
jgi:hypothetical protein